ncbi:hypothetical protein [Sphingobacterium sp. CZ-2]|uniref:hypothetical protein n=1 Tax=Sphingobacterium sp. CZ-2 TaxID=2557994 RepID=UPI00106FE160|nr:hypothetical protein [Sphingobacterium sp. CZ-2]QBR10723.1 hypothetical protein E3D81_00425 [Sphingobacterium sp. CZ-2]
MKKRFIIIYKSQFLKDIIGSIPSNCILFKTLTGIGATHLEIITPRHSIIIEPNVPVIKGKKKSHKGKIIGVYEGIYLPHIINYLKDPKVKYKKIMTTPESFHKVKEAIAEVGMDMHKEFFLLFDECDRTSKDIDFRKDIILPMEDFFKFEMKAFVSATATIPSDPRFKKQGFEILEIFPDFDYAKQLNLIQTNNPFAALKKSLQDNIIVNENEQIFIFLNSTVGIVSVIEQLGIQTQSAIFCSSNSADKIKGNGGVSVHYDIDESEFRKYNFLTSRFYSAVDIYVNEKPHIILLTDLNIAEHTMIDPYSDLIQIAGRFRGIELASLTYITNHDSELHYRTPNEAKAYLKGCAETYKTIQSLRDVSTNDGAKETLTEALERISYTRFLNDNGRINYFMVDNYLQKEELKGNFTDPELLRVTLNSEQLRKQFSLNHRDYIFNISSFYPKVNGVKNYIDIVRDIANRLQNIYSAKQDVFAIDFSEDELYRLESKHPEIIEAYHKIGMEELCKIAYSKKHIVDAISKHDKELVGASNFDFLDELHTIFSINEFYSGKMIGATFKSLVDKYNLPYRNKKKYLADFRRFFTLSNRTGRNKLKGYVILEKKFN